VILERGEAGDDLTAHAESGNAVGDHLFGVGNDLENGSAQYRESAALWLLDTLQVPVNLFGRHRSAV